MLKRSVEPGQTVAASFQVATLFTIAEDLREMELEVAVDEADVGSVKDGQQATFTVDAYPNRQYDAHVTRVAYGSTTSNNVVSYTTTLRVKNEDLSLRPGMTATAEIATTTSGNVLLVPNAALRFAPASAATAQQGGNVMRSIMPGPPRERRERGEDERRPAVGVEQRSAGGDQRRCRGDRRTEHGGVGRRGARGPAGHHRRRGSRPMTSAPPLIELVTVTKTYGEGTAEFQALAGVDVRIEDGEFVAIMGPSGSGKSTVMNILGCLDIPTTGQYLFRGIHVEELSRNQRALLRRHCLGFVFQGFNLLARTTAVENVELPLLYRGVGLDERRAAARDALKLVGLDGWETHTPAELSGGQQQRVAIARALVTHPLVLLADEPTGNLDTHRTREIMELLASLNRDRGLTIVMVTHEAQAAGYAGRVVHFLDGRVERDAVQDALQEGVS